MSVVFDAVVHKVAFVEVYLHVNICRTEGTVSRWLWCSLELHVRTITSSMCTKTYLELTDVI